MCNDLFRRVRAGSGEKYEVADGFQWIVDFMGDRSCPEMARECAYKGAEIMLRTAGYTAPIRQSWRFTNQSNAFCNLMVTANVCMSGSDGTFDSMGEGMVVNFDGSIIAHGTSGPRRRDHHGRGAPRPRARGPGPLGRREQHLPARPSRLHGREGRRERLPLYLHAGPRRGPLSPALGRRGQDTDGTGCGFPAPTRGYGETVTPPRREAAE